MVKKHEKKPRNHGLKTLGQCRRFLVSIVNRLNKGEIDRETARAFTYIVNNIVLIIQAERDNKLEQAVSELQRMFKEQEINYDQFDTN